MMSVREKKAWGLAAKVLVVAIPAAISGYTSYSKARLEARTESSAAYVTLKSAVEKLQIERSQDVLRLQHLEDELEKCLKGRSEATTTPTISAYRALSRVVAGSSSTDGGTLVETAVGAVSGRVELAVDPPPPFPPEPLPDTLEQAVQQVQMRIRR